MHSGVRIGILRNGVPEWHKVWAKWNATPPSSSGGHCVRLSEDMSHRVANLLQSNQQQTHDCAVPPLPRALSVPRPLFHGLPPSAIVLTCFVVVQRLEDTTGFCQSGQPLDKFVLSGDLKTQCYTILSYCGACQRCPSACCACFESFIRQTHTVSRRLELLTILRTLRALHTAQTQTNGQLPLSDHSVASRLTRSVEKLH